MLVIVATREGTSATIIDNTSDSFSSGSAWGQRLFFNQNGQRVAIRVMGRVGSSVLWTGSYGDAAGIWTVTA